MDLNGFDDLLRNLDRMHDDIDDDVGEIVKKNTIEMTEKTVKNERSRMKKGYWTGHTARQTWAVQNNKLSWRTFVNTDYAGFTEFGTRYMEGYFYLQSAFLSQRPQFLSDLERLVE